MAINRYEIRNVYSLGDPEVYKASDKDDSEALLEGVAMAGLAGVLRQLGDLAEFAGEIFRDLHEEVMATAARGHGILVRVKQLESEIPSIERVILSQTSHSEFFFNSGVDWHPNQQTTHNLITTGDLPRFVMDSYEECRGPPRLFLVDKFDVGGAGACLKRYTDPSVFKVEASLYETEIAETQREKKIRQTKKKGSRWKGGETPEISQTSHAKLHQLFLEERVQTGATNPARHVKLKERPKKLPFDSESGESYMNKFLDSPSFAHEVAPILSNGSRLEDSSISGSALGSPMKNTRSCVSLWKIAESQRSYADLQVDDNHITTVDDDIHTDGLQNAYPYEDIASETDNYMDALATMESESGTSVTLRTYFDANKYQLQSQLSDSQSVENSTTSSDWNNSITKAVFVSGNSDTMGTSTENASPVGAESPSQPPGCAEIPFHPRVTPITDNIPVTQKPGHDIKYDSCIDVSKVSNVDQVACLEEATLDTNEVCSDHTEKLDTSRKSDDHQIDTKDVAKCTSEHPGVLPVADDLSSFPFVKNLEGDLDNKHPNDSYIPTSLLPNISETTKNQDGYDLENHSTSHSVISHLDELSSDDNFVTEPQLKEEGEGVLVISDQSEARVPYSRGRETESHNSENEHVSVVDANTNEGIDDSVLKEGTGTESEEREIGSAYSDDKRDDGKGLGDDTKLERIEADSVNSDMETCCAVVLPVYVVRHDNNGHSVSEQESKESGEKVEVDSLLLNSKTVQDHNHSFLSETDQNQEIVLPEMGFQPVDIEPCILNAQLIDIAHEATVFIESDNDLESKSTNHIDIPEDKVDQSNNQLHMPPLPPMQWRMRKLQNSLSTLMNGGLHSGNHFPPFFPSIISLQEVDGQSTIHETTDLDTETQKSYTQHNEVKSAETLVPQVARIDPHRMLTVSHQEVFWPSLSPHPLPPVLDDMKINIRPMKIHRSPLINAVAVHDKAKLRKVSDLDTTHIPKGEEKDSLLDQIRAKSINLKPAVRTRPSIQGPTTNLRVAAILEKANAIRQAFAGSDDDDSDNWSDS